MVSLSPLAWVAVVGMLLTGGYYIADKIGDLREEQVWAKINAAIEKTNAEINKANTLDDQIAQVAEDARRKALATVAKLPDNQCKASDSVANSLSEVR